MRSEKLWEYGEENKGEQKLEKAAYMRENWDMDRGSGHCKGLGDPEV